MAPGAEGEGKPMSFRRDGKTANYWGKRLEKYPELLERAGLPDVVLQDDRSWSFFVCGYRPRSLHPAFFRAIPCLTPYDVDAP
jgi:hypothetical protein